MKIISIMTLFLGFAVLFSCGDAGVDPGDGYFSSLVLAVGESRTLQVNGHPTQAAAAVLEFHQVTLVWC